MLKRSEPAKASNDRRMTRSSVVVVCTALFTALGPLAGAVCFFVYVALDAPTSLYPAAFFDRGMLLVYVLLIYGAYLLGGLPALAAGAAYGWIVTRRKMTFTARFALGPALGVLITIVVELALIWLSDAPPPWTWILPIAGATAGAVCGLVCAFLPANDYQEQRGSGRRRRRVEPPPLPDLSAPASDAATSQ